MVDRLSLTFALLSVALSISSATCVASKLLPASTKAAVNAAAAPQVAPPPATNVVPSAQLAQPVRPVVPAPRTTVASKRHVSRSKK